MDNQHLSPFDYRSITWDRLRMTLADRRNELRMELEHDLDEKASARVRGRIAEINNILNLGQPDSGMSDEAGQPALS